MWDLSDPTVWTFLLTLGSLLATILLRKRIGKAIGRLIFQSAPEFIEGFLWEEGEEVVEGKKVRVKRLRKPVADQLEALAPALITPILKSIKIKVPKDLPINPATGQIDLMAPIVSKLVRGKNPTAMDLLAPFIPMGMELAQVVGGKIQGAISGMAGKAATAKGAALTPEAQAIVDKALNP